MQTGETTGGVILRDMLATAWLSMATGLLAGCLLVGVVLLLVPAAQAMPIEPGVRIPPMKVDEVKRGSLLLKLANGGSSVGAPLLKTGVEMNISGLSARVKVSQRFVNPGEHWAEGIYIFPLPENAAVDRMRLRIGDRLIEGEIRERERAEQIYRQAQQEGKKASLLSQGRPNIFTTAVANIAPGEEVRVEIEYQQELVYDQGRFSIRFPLVVAPRYIPGAPVGSEEIGSFQGSGWAANSVSVPDASQITPPVVAVEEGPVNPVSIQVRLDAGLPLARIESRYHPVESTVDTAGVHHVRLQGGHVPADRDFELVWVPESGAAPHAALFTEHWQGEEYALLMVMPPPVSPAQGASVPREVIFVIDTSGSMHGESIQQARKALVLALGRLGPDDCFNIIQFNHQTRALFRGAVQADPQAVAQAIRYVEALEADGGTEMLPALQRALRADGESGLLRQVVFLTDGSVGNEEELFSVIQRRLGGSRLFTVGIGSAPNSFFMTRAAEFGRGTFTYIGKVSEVQERMEGLFAKLASPVLTDIAIDLPEDAGVEVWPQRIPDLYRGEPVVVALRSPGPLVEVVISGETAGRPWRQRVKISGGSTESGLHLLWARRKIADLMNQRSRGRPEEEVRTEVVDLALHHRLVSRYTSLVAVEKRVTRPAGEDLQTRPLPVNLPHGWSADKVFGQLPRTASPAPLNLLIGLCFLLLAAVSLWIARRGGAIGRIKA